MAAAALVFVPLTVSAQYRSSAGERSEYRLDYFNATRSDLRALFGFDSADRNPNSPLAHFIETAVRGGLTRTLLRRVGPDWIVAYEFRSPHVSLRINERDERQASDGFTSGMTRPVIATVARDGRIRDLRFADATSEATRALIRSLLASTQFVFPRTREHWESREADPAGEYIARYSRDSNVTYSRKKLRYIQATMLRKGEVSPIQRIVPSGVMRATLDSVEGRLLMMNGADSQVVLVGDKTVARGVTTLSLKYARSKRATARELALLATLGAGSDYGSPQSLAVGASAEEGDAAINRAELGSETVASLLAKLDARERDVSDTSSTTFLYLKFKALVFLNPVSSRALGNRLARALPNSRTMLILSAALGEVGHTEAQGALIRTMKTRQTDWPALATLLPTLGGVRHPDEQAVDYIMTFAFRSTNPEIASTATLAAGVMARSLAVHSAKRSESIVRRLIDRARRSKSEAEQMDLLIALGNSGSAIALPTIRKLSAQRNPVMRAHAMRALVWIDAADASAILERSVASDPDSSVRAAARQSLKERSRR